MSSFLVIDSVEIEKVDPDIVEAFVRNKISSSTANGVYKKMYGLKAQLPSYLRPITQYGTKTTAKISLLELVRSLPVLIKIEDVAERLKAADQALEDDWHMAGAAVTCALTPGHNLWAHAAIEQCTPGSVLVVGSTTPEPLNYGNIGGLMGAQMMFEKRDVAGVIINGGSRDTREILRMPLEPPYKPLKIWAANPEIEDTGKGGDGSVNHPINIGREIKPGDLVVADVDGVAVFSREHVTRELLDACFARDSKESKASVRHKGGSLSIDETMDRDLRAAIRQIEAAKLSGPR